MHFRCWHVGLLSWVCETLYYTFLIRADLSSLENCHAWESSKLSKINGKNWEIKGICSKTRSNMCETWQVCMWDFCPVFVKLYIIHFNADVNGTFVLCFMNLIRLYIMHFPCWHVGPLSCVCETLYHTFLKPTCGTFAQYLWTLILIISNADIYGIFDLCLWDL